MMKPPTLVSISPTIETTTNPVLSARSGSRQVTALLWVLLAGTVVRLLLGYAFRNEPIHIEDEHDYDQLARNLLDHGEFTFHPGGTATSIRPPLYPAVVAFVYRLAGSGNLAGCPITASLFELDDSGRCILARTGNRWRTDRVVASRFMLLLPFFARIYQSAAHRDAIHATVDNGLLRNRIDIDTEFDQLGCNGGSDPRISCTDTERCVVGPPFLAIYLLLACRQGFVRRLAVAAALVAGFAIVVRALGGPQYSASGDLHCHRHDGRPKLHDGELPLYAPLSFMGRHLH